MLARALRWLDEHLFEPVGVGDLARAVHSSEATLLRVFKRELGTSPASHQRARRLEAGVLMLRAGDKAVGEVATQLGYASLSAFTTAFRRHFGVPPSAFHKVVIARTVLPPHGEPPKAE